MGRAFKILGNLFSVVAVVIIAYGVSDNDDWLTPSIAEVWASINANSLVGFGSLVENKIDPDLWVDTILPILTWPVWSLAVILSAVFLLIGWILRRKKREHTD